MTSERKHRRWQRVARAAAVVTFAWAVYLAASGCGDLRNAWRTSAGWVRWGNLLAVLSFMLGVSGAVTWVAWRLWFRWNAATIRAVVALVVGILAAYSAATIAEFLARATGHPALGTGFSGAMLAALIVTALLYRRVTRAVIRSAGLADPLDEYGQPAGHAGRVKAFCVLLGLGVCQTAMDVVQWRGWAANPHGPGWVQPTAIIGPLLLGWGTYKLVGWRLSPRTRPAVPAGGFEVLPAAGSLGGE